MKMLVAGTLAWMIGMSAAAAAAPSSRPAGTWLPLRGYPRPAPPDTGWGIHDNPNCGWVPDRPEAFFHQLKRRWGFSWFKVLACGQNKLGVVAAARRAGVEPVVRLYASTPHPHFPAPGPEETEFVNDVRAYVKAGARYFECGNEPNLSDEWATGEWDKPQRIERLCRQWLRARRLVSDAGGIPVFYALAPGSSDRRSAPDWWEDCFKTFQRWGKTDEAFAGAAFGAHLGTLNHPLDYPFDASRDLPGGTAQERIASLRKDCCTYQCVHLLVHMMDTYLPQRIPILSTEGGAFPDNHDDKDYPAVTPERHRALNLGIFARFNPRHPKYWGDALFAQMSWIYHADDGPFARDSWFENPVYGDMPILDALEKAEKFDRGGRIEP